MAIEPAYSISSKASGGGRDGEVVSASGQIDLELRPPKELGGSGDGSNPEELFSAGYAACF
ncbi:MAG TPA: organic hydroperoxide resistance protein, partial [Gordonia polyisoprenivorans]|nr:organic hydroperoxide resistance protein [Gordonia polyisoprenivorans]